MSIGSVRRDPLALVEYSYEDVEVHRIYFPISKVLLSEWRSSSALAATDQQDRKPYCFLEDKVP